MTESAAGRWRSRPTAIATGSAAAILLHLALRFGDAAAATAAMPLYAALVLGGVPLVYAPARKVARRQFGSDTLAAISIGTSVEVVDLAVDDIVVGDTLVIHPHDLCPVDGVVIDGHGTMDESYLTGEPFQMTKTRGSTVISGAINGGTVRYRVWDSGRRTPPVNFFMKKFQRLGFIDYKDGLKVNNSLLTVVLHE